MILKYFISILFLSVLATTSFAENLPAFAKVNDSIMRGGRPTKEGIRLLKEMGVKTIINLENNNSVVKNEKKWVNSKGMTYISVPMTWWSPPSDSDLNLVFGILNDSSQQPIFIHCHHGEDRTGLVIGLFRFYYEGWTAKQSYKEMLDLGFHPSLTVLDDYFKNTTGY